MPPVKLRMLTPPNIISGAITLTAMVMVAGWAMSPVHRPLEYHLGSSGQGRAVLSPRHVPVLFDGFSAAEPWGRWTDSPTATVTFGRPLARGFTLSMTAHAFGPNAGVPIRVCADDECQAVSLGTDDQLVKATFHTRHRTRRVVIHVPHPTAPGKDDPRLLGIGVVSLGVEEAR